MSRRVQISAGDTFAGTLLVDGATISWNLGNTHSFFVTLGGNRAMAAPTGGISGNIYILRVIQDGTGSRTLTWDSTYKFQADGPPILSLAAAAEDDFVFVSDGTNLHCLSGQKRGLAPRGYIDGLIMSNDTDTDHDISVSAGEATLIESTTGETRVFGVNSSAFVKQIDAAWTAGSAAGGFPSGISISTGTQTWYHYYMIATIAGLVDFGYDTSTTAANLLADATAYTFYRRIGSVMTDTTNPGNITQFTQTEDYFRWNDPPEDIDETITDNGETITLSVPTGYAVRVHLNIDNDIDSNVYFRTSEIANEGPSSTAAPFAHIQNNHGPMNVITAVDTLAQLVVEAGASPSGNLEIATLGWWDDRGRNA